jgi:hypothetical protein
MHPNKKTLVLEPFDISEGHNNAVWNRARQCRFYGHDKPNAPRLIDAWLTANAHLFQRAIPHHEVEQQINNAYGYAGVAPGPDVVPRERKKKEEKQKESPALVDFVESAFADFGVTELKQESRLEKDVHCPVDYLAALFFHPELAGAHNLWVCVGTTLPGMRTLKIGALKPRDVMSPKTPPKTHYDLQFVVPNPMTKETGLTKTGHIGWRTRDNAVSEDKRLFYVVEFDYDTQGNPVPKDVQARRLWCLNTFTNGCLALVVDSGGKSLQGWFRTHTLAQREVEVFWKVALALGADPRGAQPEQAFRAPNGTRYPKDGPGETKRQEVIFFKASAGRYRL